MGKKSKIKRSLVDITLSEAIQVMKLGEGYDEDMHYRLRKKENCQGLKFAQLYYVPDHKGTFCRLGPMCDHKETIAANFSDSKDAVTLWRGNEYYRTFYRITKYLEERGFDLESANKKK